MRNLFLAIALTLGTQPLAAQEAITSETIATAEGEIALKQSLVVETGLADAWALFTTDAGVRQWMAPVGAVDLRSGGAIRTNYNACAAPGDEGTITNTIVNFVPQRFLTLQADLVPQREAEWMNEAIFARRDNLYSVIEFEAVSQGRTRITIWGLGYGTGPEWETMLGFFIAGNEWTLAQLQKAVAGEQAFAPCADEAATAGANGA